MAVPKKTAKMDKFTYFSRKIEKTANFMNFRVFLIKFQIVGSKRVIVQKEREKMH